MKGVERGNKSDKKKPQKTLMEKRAEKQAKKKNRGGSFSMEPKT